MQADLDKAYALQADVQKITTVLAEMIARPATQRDPTAIHDTWQQVQHWRPRLSASFRRLRKSVRDADKSALRRDANSELKVLNRRLLFWEEMERLVHYHAAPPSTELALHRAPLPQDEVLSFLYGAMHKLANPNAQDNSAMGRSYFADIPMEIQRFELLISAAYRLLLVKGQADSARFLDVGCGGATKVLAASRVFARCDGLEYDPGYVTAGQNTLRLTAPNTGEVMLGDALEYEGYDQYDVIYYYRPVRNDALLFKMSQRIVEQAKPGTIILAPYNLYLAAPAEFPAACITGPIYVTGVDQDAADAWHKDAQHTSTDLIRRARHVNFDPGFWAPLLEAASFNGDT